MKENEGPREVCVVLNTTSSEAVTVELTSADGSAVDGQPYLPITKAVMFTFPVLMS